MPKLDAKAAGSPNLTVFALAGVLAGGLFMFAILGLIRILTG